jgi:DNA invertase Pin-like site-specific DNA recombinase
MTRWAIYARYSSEHQNERSIEDQVRLCREHVSRLGGEIADIYADYALSGAHLASRPSAVRLLADAEDGKIDGVMAEALDRLSRDLEDTAALYKRLTFAGVRLVTASEGEISELHVGLKGTMNALFLKDLAAKIRRGQTGTVAKGRSAGGLSYGYAVKREIDGRGELVRGLREVNPAQAEIVRRIFREYAAGDSPRSIAARLNRDGILSPTGGEWMASAINGNRARGVGILWQEAYVGRLVYNKVRMVKDPKTGKRISRPNPPEQWQVVEVPELRIVSDDVWTAVQSIKAGYAHLSVSQRRRPRHPYV